MEEGVTRGNPSVGPTNGAAMQEKRVGGCSLYLQHMDESLFIFKHCILLDFSLICYFLDTTLTSVYLNQRFAQRI
jgi:hypothetical protein